MECKFQTKLPPPSAGLKGSRFYRFLFVAVTVFLLAAVCVGTAVAVDIGSFDALKQAIEGKESQIYIVADIPLGENDLLPVIEHTVTIIPKGGDWKIYRTAANMTENVGMLTVGSQGSLTLDKNGQYNLTLDGNCSYVTSHHQPLVRVNGGEFILDSGNLINNSANVAGVGVSINDNGHSTMNGGFIFNNTADETWDSGGGVYVNTACTFILNGGIIANNTVKKNGGGIGSFGSVEIHGGLITNNTACDNNRGSGVAIGSGTLTMTGGNVTNNFGQAGITVKDGATAKISGGNITNSYLYHPMTSKAPGLIINGGGSFVQITGGYFAKNSAGILIGNGKLDISGGMIVDNTNGIAVTNTNGILNISGGKIAQSTNYDITFKGAQFNVSGNFNIVGKVKLETTAGNGGIISVIDDFEGTISNIETAKATGQEVINLSKATKPAAKYLNHFKLTTTSAKYLGLSLDVPSLVVADSDPTTTPHTLTIINGTSATSTQSTHNAGDVVTLTADSPANPWQKFYNWSSTVSNVVEYSNAKVTKVWMPNSDVTVTANYVEIDTISLSFGSSYPYYPGNPLEIIVTATNSSTGMVIDTYPFEITCNGVAIGTDNKTGTPVLYTPQEVGTYIMNVTLSARTVITEEITISVVSPPSQPSSSSSSQGSSVWLTETPTPTPTETVAPTPTDAVPTDIPDVKPTQTPDSPTPILGILAGLGVAVAVLRRR